MLEIGDRLADRGLRQIQPLRRPAEAARLDHRVEATDLVALDLHGGIVVGVGLKPDLQREMKAGFINPDSGIAAANRIAARCVVPCARKLDSRSNGSWAS